MSGARSRRKGHRFEREVACLFSEALGVEARRGLQSRDGSEAPDVVVPGVPVWLELKRGRRPRIRGALRQAVETAPPGAWPVAVTRADREEALATLRLEDLLEILGQWWRVSR